MDRKKIVVIGGGTGTFTVLSGLKKYENLDLTAVVTMADNGGSTGRLRDEFGILPVGDMRMCLVALAKEAGASKILRDLFLYRFPNSESSLAGHNFGNILLTALNDLLGSETEAVLAAEKILNISGKVYPITTENINLFARYKNGETVEGESYIDEPEYKQNKTLKIEEIWVEPECEIYPPAKRAIENTDYILIGPGDLYTSILANIVVNGTAKVIKNSDAKLIYTTNLMSKYGQTDDMKISNYIEELNKYIGRKPDHVLINNTDIPESILKKYEEKHAFPIEDDLGANYEGGITRADIISKQEVKKKSGDVREISLIRHDSDKLAEELIQIMNEFDE